MRKHVYRKGDRIRVIRPRVVDRVGYPKQVYDYVPEDVTRDMKIAEKVLQGMSLADATVQVDISLSWGSWGNRKPLTLEPRTTSLMAYYLARRDGFGGKERSIHFRELSDWPGCTFSWYGYKTVKSAFVPFETEVLSKRVAKTGTYFPPYFGSSDGYYDSEDYYEPGGLADSKTHVIIRTQYGEFVTDDIEPVKNTDETI